MATFVCTERFDIVASHEVRFSDAGDRVALVVLLRSRKVRTPCRLLMCACACLCACVMADVLASRTDWRSFCGGQYPPDLSS